MSDRTKPQGITARALKQQTFSTAPHIVPGIVPTGCSVLAAKSGLNKTWLELAIALAVVTGGEVLGEQAVQGHALIIAPDEAMENLQTRLEIMLDNEGEWPEGLTLYDEWPRLHEGGLELLDAALTADPLIRFVGLDTFEHVRKQPARNANPYSEDVSAVQPLRILAKKHPNVALVAVHHATKADNYDDPMMMISGTMGLMGTFDHRIILFDDGGATRLYLKGKRMEERKLRVVCDPISKHWTVAEDYDDDGSSEHLRRVLAALATIKGDASPAEVANVCGLNPKAVAVYLGRLKRRGAVVKAGYGKYRLSESRTPAPAVPVVATVPPNDGIPW
jgi:hypothetical protein